MCATAHSTSHGPHTGEVGRQILATIVVEELSRVLRELGDEKVPSASPPPLSPPANSSHSNAPPSLPASSRTQAARQERLAIIRQPTAGTCTPPLAPFRRCVFSLIASSPIWNNCCACSRRCCVREAESPSFSFHSGEDRLVKTAFREGQRTGIYSQIWPNRFGRRSRSGKRIRVRVRRSRAGRNGNAGLAPAVYTTAREVMASTFCATASRDEKHECM